MPLLLVASVIPAFNTSRASVEAARRAIKRGRRDAAVLLTRGETGDRGSVHSVFGPECRRIACGGVATPVPVLPGRSSAIRDEV